MAKVFFSYSHRDEKARDELEVHLSALKRQGIIETWHDRRIGAGIYLKSDIDVHLEAADIILLLVSSYFIASDYCYELEMKRAMERHKARDARVIPVILRPCEWQHTLFGELRATPPDGKAVSKFGNQHDAFLSIVKDIRKAAEDMVKCKSDNREKSQTSFAERTKLIAKPVSRNLQRNKALSDPEKARLEQITAMVTNKSRITYSQIVEYLDSISTTLNTLLHRLEVIIIHERNNNNIPVYMTRARIKSYDSVYLKTKRNEINDLNDIPDYAGLRVLCLFEQELLTVHSIILHILSRSDMKSQLSLNAFQMFNWPQYQYLPFVERIKDEFQDLSPRLSMNSDGCKLIVYRCSYRENAFICNLEIQLCTIMQDVRLELEHALCSKMGNIHFHIKKTCESLCRDLDTNDMLLSHLKSFNDQEAEGQSYARDKFGLIRWFHYEDGSVPKLFRRPEHRKAFMDYIQFMEKVKHPSRGKYIEEALALFDALCSRISAVEVEIDESLRYFLKMERAHLKYWNGEYEEALAIYQSLAIEFPNSYKPYFRIGEILFIKGEIAKSLIAFDQCELSLSRMPSHYEITFKVQTRFTLAYIYWMLGPEYIDYSLDMMLQIKDLTYAHPYSVDNDQIRTYVNNSCAYALEKYIITHSDDDYYIAQHQFALLEPLLDKEDATANMIDTAAWFLYNSYLRDADKNKLNKARQYCHLISERANAATLRTISFNIHQMHLQEIMSAK